MPTNRRLVLSAALTPPVVAALGCGPAAPPPTAFFSDRLAGPLLAERDWRADSSMPAIEFAGEALYLRSSSTQTAFVRALFLPRATTPASLSNERLSWRCRVRPTGTFFIVLDAELGPLPLRVQVAPYGAHVTASGADRAVTGHEIRLPARWSEENLNWRLERNGTSCELWVGEQRLWKGETSAPLTAVAFGETNVDTLHGGEIWLSHVDWRGSSSPRALG